MITILLLFVTSTCVFPVWFAWDVRKAGGVRALYAELTGTVLPVPEIPGQRGWTRAMWADPAWGVDPVTGGPRYDGVRS